VAKSPHASWTNRPRFVLISSADEPIHRDGLARWLHSFGELVGIVELHADRPQKVQRLRRELKQVGPLRFLDGLAFRAYANLFQSAADAAWERRQLRRLRLRFPDLPATIPVLPTDDPNGEDVEHFLQLCEPTIVLARCATPLAEPITTIPTHGAFVMQPGIGPQYRSDHGCFWAMAEDDLRHVGITLLKIDRGGDNGFVYGYYRCPFNPVRESHHVIQDKAVLENLRSLETRFLQIAAGTARPIPTRPAESRTWGQPWLTAYLQYRRREQRRQATESVPRPTVLLTPRP
jgi:hypothetical protein